MAPSAPRERAFAGGRIVKSRYLQYEKKDPKKVLGHIVVGSAKDSNGPRSRSDLWKRDLSKRLLS
uniref:Uncharacterized protein n=1 Tax=Anser cygnoides TaxID=8845 RepID=A0A8B9EBI9_ANSCY